MIEPAELFARLSAQLEDLHGLTIEGQSSDLSPDMIRIVLDQFCNGLHMLRTITDQIEVSLGARL